jgi:hypothetical protein
MLTSVTPLDLLETRAMSLALAAVVQVAITSQIASTHRPSTGLSPGMEIRKLIVLEGAQMLNANRNRVTSGDNTREA